MLGHVGHGTLGNLDAFSTQSVALAQSRRVDWPVAYSTIRCDRHQSSLVRDVVWAAFCAARTRVTVPVVARLAALRASTGTGWEAKTITGPSDIVAAVQELTFARTTGVVVVRRGTCRCPHDAVVDIAIPRHARGKPVFGLGRLIAFASLSVFAYTRVLLCIERGIGSSFVNNTGRQKYGEA